MAKLFTLLLLVFVITGCREPMFHEGSFVKSKLTGQRGQVLDTICNANKCIYKTRFSIEQATTKTSIFGDKPITRSPFAIEWMEEYELE